MISKRATWLFTNAFLEISLSRTCSHKNKNFFLINLRIFIFGFLKIVELYLLQKKNLFNKYHNHVPSVEHLVIEAQAPHMHLNYFRYFNKEKVNQNYLILECFNKKQYTKIVSLNFLTIFKEFYLTYLDVIQALKITYSLNVHNDLLSEARRGLPVFSYQLCLFKLLKKENSNIKLFSGGAHLASAAAIESGIETYYLSHGLIDRGRPFNFRPSIDTHYLSLPNFDYIFMHSNDEIEYLKKYNVRSNFCLYPQSKIQNKEKKVIFFLSPYHSSKEEMYLNDAIKFFIKNKYEVILKLHPTYEGDLSENIFNTRTVRVIESDSKNASELIKSESPEFVCSFASTSLCEALNHGVIPICLTEIKKLNSEANHLYPFREKTLFWESAQPIIIDAVINPSTSKQNAILETLESDN